MSTRINDRPTPPLRRGLLALAALALAASAACNNLLDVKNPGSVPEDALSDPSLAPALAAGAIQTFQCGLESFVGTAGMLSGEYLSANGFVNNHVWEWRGIVEIKQEPGTCNFGRNTTSMGFYTPLQQARFQLEDTFRRLDGFTDDQVPGRARLIAQMRAYAGYTYLLLGEGMCQMTIDRGPLMTRAQVLAIAEARFSDAITRAAAFTDTAGVSIRYMALVGRARTRLDLGNLAGAAEDANLVPAGFVRNAEFSEGGVATRENRIYNLTIRNDFLSVADAYRTLKVAKDTTGVDSVPDPRVKVRDAARKGPDGVTPIWQQQKYIAGAGGAPIPIASWAEAQLIYAEAIGGQAGLDAINRVRAASGITKIIGPAPTGAAFTALVLEERRRQLFSEGQRYVDMLRYNLPFPSGVNRKGQTYSDLTCVPLPDVETQNNPNLH